MYIYLDESYNLGDRNKKQFISINGFMTTDAAAIRKRWLRARKPFANKKRRIHATDTYFKELRGKMIEVIKNNPLYLITARQNIKLIPTGRNSKYFVKNKLNFERIYADLCKHLLFSLKLSIYKKVVITIDNRKVKEGLIGKNKFRNEITEALREKYPGTIIEKLRLVPSSSDILLEFTDFISNSFYKGYLNNEDNSLAGLKIKMTQIKNPLK